MVWESWSAFWQMGGAWPFVWGSYGVTLAFVVAELVLVLRRRKDTVRRLIVWRRALGKDRVDKDIRGPQPDKESMQ